MTGSYKIKGIILMSSILLCLFSLTNTNALEKQRLQVKSYPINGPVSYFNIRGKSYITIGENKDSILIASQANKTLIFPDGKRRTFLMQKGPGDNDSWIGKYRGGIYRSESDNAVLTANIEYRNAFIDGKEETFLMEKEVGRERWQVVKDGKIYYENSERKLVLSGNEELRKIILDDKELYLLMRKELKPDSVWECEYNGKILWSK